MSGLSLETYIANLKPITLTVLELLLTGPLTPLRTHTHTHRQTSNENSISAIHSVHLAEIINLSSPSFIKICKIFALPPIFL